MSTNIEDPCGGASSSTNIDEDLTNKLTVIAESLCFFFVHSILANNVGQTKPKRCWINQWMWSSRRGTCQIHVECLTGIHLSVRVLERLLCSWSYTIGYGFCQSLIGRWWDLITEVDGPIQTSEAVHPEESAGHRRKFPPSYDCNLEGPNLGCLNQSIHAQIRPKSINSPDWAWMSRCRRINGRIDTIREVWRALHNSTRSFSACVPSSAFRSLANKPIKSRWKYQNIISF